MTPFVELEHVLTSSEVIGLVGMGFTFGVMTCVVLLVVLERCK